MAGVLTNDHRYCPISAVPLLVCVDPSGILCLGSLISGRTIVRDKSQDGGRVGLHPRFQHSSPGLYLKRGAVFIVLTRIRFSEGKPEPIDRPPSLLASMALPTLSALLLEAFRHRLRPSKKQSLLLRGRAMTGPSHPKQLSSHHAGSKWRSRDGARRQFS